MDGSAVGGVLSAGRGGQEGYGEVDGSQGLLKVSRLDSAAAYVDVMA